jgi:tetratricopeptide (TPR) repeat protein
VIICTGSYAKDDFYRKGRSLQTEGKSEQAIEAYIKYLTSPVRATSLDDKRLGTYTDALVQMMNLFQSKGDPDTCPSVLQRVFKESSILQNELLRDFNSVLGYALSRTEHMDKAEEIMLKALTLPLYKPTPERYFRDYAYAAAVFYSNPEYQNEVINWCNEALTQAELCKDTSGKQWAMSMLGSLYKRNGNLSGALDLFQRCIDDSRTREDELGMLNGLNSLVDLFLYWKLPEYADIHASEAVDVEIISEDIPGWLVANEGNITIALDVTITEELKQEGIAREIVNRVQNIRKGRDYEITDKINLVFQPNETTDAAINAYSEYIGRQVLATNVCIGSVDGLEGVETLDIDELNMNVSITINK